MGEFRPARVFVYDAVFDDCEGTPLGLKVHQAESGHLVIDAIMEGRVDVWNVLHPKQKIRVGDQIEEINGCPVESADLQAMSNSSKLEVKFRRQVTSAKVKFGNNIKWFNPKQLK